MKFLRILNILIVITMLVLPVVVFAQTPTTRSNITNPAQGYFVDLTSLGRGYNNTFPDLLEFLILTLFGLAGILAIAFLIWGGFNYITARGDEEMAKSGKKTVTNAIIGLVIIILAYTIVVVTINALYGNPGP